MSAGSITDFLNELSESESLAALRTAYNQQSPLVFKVETSPNPIKAFIGTFIDKRVMLITEPINQEIPTEKEISIKFFIGTEVFFIKTNLKAHMNHYYFDMSAKVIQLKRRKEPRYVIPKTWQQGATIISKPPVQEFINCNVIDISNSGMRVEVLNFMPIYQRNDIIKIKFHIHKRSEVGTMAIVRFILVRQGFNTQLGLEFADISKVHSERVASIVGDIQLFNSSVKN
jgi:hypothetical protein